MLSLRFATSPNSASAPGFSVTNTSVRSSASGRTSAVGRRSVVPATSTSSTSGPWRPATRRTTTAPSGSRSTFSPASSPPTSGIVGCTGILSGWPGRMPAAPRPEIEYRGLVARTWDLLRGDTSAWEDRPFFRRLIESSGQPALDVGCGTGRLLLDYLRGGIDIDGVDISGEMLALCRERAETLGLKPRLYEQPMEALDLPGPYYTIIVPSSSFQLLLEPAAARQAMGRFFAHLQPGGVLVMPFIMF